MRKRLKKITEDFIQRYNSANRNQRIIFYGLGVRRGIMKSIARRMRKKVSVDVFISDEINLEGNSTNYTIDLNYFLK